MIFKQAEVHCVAVDKYPSRFFCLGYDGHRKYVSGPRRRMVIAGVSGLPSLCCGIGAIDPAPWLVPLCRFVPMPCLQDTRARLFRL